VGLMGLSVVGILVFEVVFQLFNIFQHSNLALPVKWEKRLNYLFVGPAIHRRHHSVERDELNSNYATIFSFWDRLFTTRQEGAFSATIEYGIKGMGDLSLVKILSLPLQRDR
jgi:sterol desaturase/sphingolipid hydroxylase (fatty acid hydroxylase superfamily)